MQKKEFITNKSDKNEFSANENDKNEFSADENNKNAFKPYHKIREQCYYTGKFGGAPHSIFNLICKTLKTVPVIFHNGSTYDYQFIFNQIAKEFKDQLECLGENTEKYITFSVPIKKKT